MAMHLLSERTAAAFETYFPNDKAKQSLAKFIRCLANAFKVATSRVVWDKKDHLHSALGYLYFEEQKAVLMELYWYMENTKFHSPHNYFQEGFLVTINSLLGLQNYLKEKFDLPYLLTSKVTNDHHERFFGRMRQADGKGGNRRPTALQLTYRVSRSLNSEIFKQGLS